MRWVTRFLQWGRGGKKDNELEVDRLRRPEWGSDGRRVALHLGCSGGSLRQVNETLFRSTEWQEIRVDLDVGVQPDWLRSIDDLDEAPPESVDLIYCSHALEHLPRHRGNIALQQWRRLLRQEGVLWVVVPDLGSAAAAILHQGLESPLYFSPVGPICAHDLLYGFGREIEAGNELMAHRSGYTAQVLSEALVKAGFGSVWVGLLAPFNLVAYGVPQTLPKEEFRRLVEPFVETYLGDPLFRVGWETMGREG
ncbi:MAG: methyltransferase domain-containing protein [Hydrogenophilus sp.]|nr:methyltransferase domain-containing protein [Hydrogenophilus sp.]